MKEGRNVEHLNGRKRKGVVGVGVSNINILGFKRCPNLLGYERALELGRSMSVLDFKKRCLNLPSYERTLGTRRSMSVLDLKTMP